MDNLPVLRDPTRVQPSSVDPPHDATRTEAIADHYTKVLIESATLREAVFRTIEFLARLPDEVGALMTEDDHWCVPWSAADLLFFLRQAVENPPTPMPVDCIEVEVPQWANGVERAG